MIRRGISLVLVWLIAAAAPPWTAASSDDGADIKVGIGGNYAGQTQARPGRWSSIKAIVTNDGDAARQFTVVYAAHSNPNLQFARKIWVPGQSVRIVNLPHRTTSIAPRPAEAQGPPTHDGSVALYEVEAGGDAALGETYTILQPVSTGDFTTVVLGGDESSHDIIQDAHNALDRENAKILRWQARSFPIDALLLDGIDSLVLAGADQPLNSAQLASIRQWLAAGGRLWLQLDRTGHGVARDLLRDDWTAVSLGEQVLHRFTPPGTKEKVVFSDGVSVPRIEAPDWQVLASVDDWTVAFTRRIGKGRVLVTTLDVCCWSAPLDEDGRALKPEFPDYLGKAWLSELPEPDTSPAVKAMDAFAAERIGARVVRQTTVAGILGGFVVLMALIGFVLYRRGRSELLAPAGGVAALLVAAALVAIGSAARESAPLTVATGQIIHVAAGQGLSVAEGRTMVYAPSALDGAVTTAPGNRMWPEQLRRGGRPVRVLMGGLGQTEWRGYTPPPGAMTPFIAQRVEPAEPTPGVRIELTDGPARIIADPQYAPQLETPFLMTQHGAVRLVEGEEALRLRPNAAPMVDASIPVEGGTVDANESRRLDAARRLLTSRNALALGEESTLMGWTDEVPPVIQLDDEPVTKGEGLAILPLTVERPAGAAPFVIPWALAPLTSVGSESLDRAILDWPESFVSAQVYDAATEQWRPMKGVAGRANDLSLLIDRKWTDFRDAYFPLGFTLPWAVADMRVTSVRILMAVEAPGREMRCYIIKDGQPVQVASRNQPNGEVEFVLSGATAPEPDRRGTIMVVIRMVSSGDESSPWTVRRPRAIVTGRVE